MGFTNSFIEEVEHARRARRKPWQQTVCAWSQCFELCRARAGFVDEKHNFPGSIAAYCSDGAGIVIGSLMGSSPLTVFVGAHKLLHCTISDASSFSMFQLRMLNPSQESMSL